MSVRRLLTQLELDRKYLYLNTTTPSHGSLQRGKLLPDGKIIEARVVQPPR